MRACVLCGAEVTARDPDYPYCAACHYSGQAENHLREAQVARFREVFPDAQYVEVEHTGGGCFWLAFRWEGDDTFYAATDGQAGLPTDENGKPFADGGWGVVIRMNDVDEDSPDYEGTILGEWDDDRGTSDEAVIETIRSDRASRVGGAT